MQHFKFREVPLTALTKAVISTDLGDILGSVQTRLDPRQNKTVTWTAYYVSTNPLAWYIHMSGFKGKGENKVVKFSTKNKNLILDSFLRHPVDYVDISSKSVLIKETIRVCVRSVSSFVRSSFVTLHFKNH